MQVFIADDHTIFREGLIRILEENGKIEIVGQAGRGDEAWREIQSCQPEIAILDVTMPGLNGLEIAGKIREQNLPTKVVILTMYDDEEYLNQALDAGVLGYLLKENAVSELLNCLGAIAKKQYYVSPALSQYLVRRSAKTRKLLDEQEGLTLLTEAEKRVLKLLSVNKTSKEIAAALHISFRTVQTHRNNISQKLNLRGHNKLLEFALQNRSSLMAID